MGDVLNSSVSAKSDINLGTKVNMVKPLQKKTLRYKSPASNQGVPKAVEVYKHFEPSKTHLLSKKPYKYKEADFPTVIPTEIDISGVDSRGLKQREGRSVDNSFKDAILCERARSNRNQKLKSSTDTNLTVNNALRLMENRIKANIENLKKREPLIHPKPGKIKNDAIRRPLKLDAKLVEEDYAENTSGCQVFIKDGEDVAKIGKTTSGLLYDVDEFIHLNSAHRLYRDYMYQDRGTEEEETAKNDLSASSSEAQRSSQPISSIISTRQSEIQKRISNENVRRENKESKEVDLGNGYSVIFEEPDTLSLQNQIDDNLAQSVSNTQLIYKKLTEEDEGSYCLLPHVKMNEEDLKARLRELRLELGGDKYHKVQDGTSATTSKTASINGEANQELQEDKKKLCTPSTPKKVKEAQGKTSALEKSLEPFQSKFKATSDKINKRQICADTSTTSHAKNEGKQGLEGTGKKSCKSSTCQKVKQTETDLPEKVSRKTSSIRVSKSSTEIQSEPLQSSDSSKVIHGDFAQTPSTNTSLLLPDVIALRNELDTTKQTCHEEIRKSVNELRSEIAQYRQALNINVNILSGKLLPETMSGVSSLEGTIRNQAEDDISKTKKIQDEQELSKNTGKTQPIHNFSESDVHDGSSRIKRTGSNLLEVDRPVKKSQSELMINPNTEFSEQLKFEDDLPKSNTEEIACNFTKTDKSELLNYQETVAMSVLTTTKSATRQQLTKQSTKLEPNKNWSKPPNDEEVKSENKVGLEAALPISVRDISFTCKEVEKCGDELTTNLRNVLDVLKLSLQLQSQIDENKRFRNMPNYDFKNIVQADFDEVICNLNGLIKSVGLENEVTGIESGGNLTPTVGNGININNSAESKPSPENHQSEVNESVKISHASCCENMRNNINMLMQALQQSKEEQRNEMKKTTEIILQEFSHYKQMVTDYIESPLRESQCAKSSNKRPRERDCSFVPIIQTTCRGRIENPCLEKKVRLFPVSPDPPRRTGKCGCKGPFVEVCPCRKKDDKISGKPQEKNEDEKRCHIFGCASSCINIQQEEKKPEVDKVPRERSVSGSRTKKPEQISLSSSVTEHYEIISENTPLSDNETDNQNKPDEVLLTAKTGSSSAIDSLPNQAENRPSQIEESITPPVSKPSQIEESITPPVSKPSQIEESITPPVSKKVDVDEDEADLNTISEKSEKSPTLELESPTKKLVIQNMPQINIRPPLTLHKIFDIEIKPTGSFSYRSPDFRNIHYEEIFSPLTNTIAQQTSSTLLKKLNKVDEVCSCGPQDIKVDLVQIPKQTIPDSEGAKLSSGEATEFNSAELTKSDTDTVQLVSEISEKSCSIDTDSEELVLASSESKSSIEKTTTVSSSKTIDPVLQKSLEVTSESIEKTSKSSADKTTKVSSSKITDQVLQKSLEAPAKSESLEKSSRSDSKTNGPKVIKTVPVEAGSKKNLKTKLDPKVGLAEKPAVQEPAAAKDFVPAAAPLPPVKSEAARISTSPAKKSFLNEAGIIKTVPENIDLSKIGGTKTTQVAAPKRPDAKEKTKRPEIGTCAIPVKDCACSPEDLQRKEIETPASLPEAVDIQREQLQINDPEVPISAQENSVKDEKSVPDADSKDTKPNQLTGLLERSRSLMSESEPNIKYVNEAYREQTVSEKQFGPHPESSASAHSVPEVEAQPPSVPKVKMPLDSHVSEEVECECNLVSKVGASGQIPITLLDAIKPQVSLQKSSESVYVLTHDISIQSSPTHLPVAKNSVPVKRKSLGGKRNSAPRGSKVKPRKRSTFKSPVSSKVSSLTKSNEKSLTLEHRSSLKGTLPQRQSNPKKINNLSKPKGRGSTEADRPNSAGVSTSEASKRHVVIPEETIPEQDDHSPTVMSVAVQYQVQKPLVDVLYPRLHKSRNCKDLDISSSEFDGYNKLCKNKLSDDTEDSSINPYRMYCGDSFDYMRKYQIDGDDEVNSNKFKKIVRRPKQRISFSSASNSTSHKLEESLSEGEIRCKCSISIGELHICRYVQQLKNRDKASRRKRDECPPSCRKWDTSKSESSTKIDSTEPSSDT